MAKNEKRDTERLHNLFDALGEVREKEASILEEIRKIVAGGQTIGEMLKLAEDQWQRHWSTRYPGAYVWHYTKDRPQMKRLLRALGFDEVGIRIQRYIRNDDPFFVKARHSFGAFVVSVNQHAGPASPAAPELETFDEPVDCDHIPRCKDDVEHTRLRSNETHGRT